MNKKQLIIEAAIKVFARDGLEKGKIADIAKEAGIGKGTVYEYFRSKDDIFKVIEESVFSDFRIVFEELNSSILSPTKKLSNLLEKNKIEISRQPNSFGPKSVRNGWSDEFSTICRVLLDKVETTDFQKLFSSRFLLLNRSE